MGTRRGRLKFRETSCIFLSRPPGYPVYAPRNCSVHMFSRGHSTSLICSKLSIPRGSTIELCIRISARHQSCRYRGCSLIVLGRVQLTYAPWFRIAALQREVRLSLWYFGKVVNVSGFHSAQNWTPPLESKLTAHENVRGCLAAPLQNRRTSAWSPHKPFGTEIQCRATLVLNQSLVHSCRQCARQCCYKRLVQ